MIIPLSLFLVTSILFFWWILNILFRPDKKLARRMEHYLSTKHEEGPKEQIDYFKHFNVMIQRFQKRFLTKEKNTKLETKLAQAGLPLKPVEYLLFQWILTAFLGGIFFLISGQWLFILIGGSIGLFFPKWYLRKKKRERITKFNDGLADMITTIVGSLRAGFSFPQALKSVAEEAASPMKEELEAVLTEMQYGKNIEDALKGLNARMPSEDLELMIQAILIQRQIGGNLATVLDKIVETIRDRTRIQRQIITLTAQGRLSGYVIGLMPVILGLVLYFIQPKYIGTLFHSPIGIAMLIAGFISGIIGFMMIKKITTIEV